MPETPTLAPKPRDYAACEAALARTWNEIARFHPADAAKAFVAAHWSRYAHVLASLPPLAEGSPVLEVGASIVASALKRVYGLDVSVAYHELEPEWEARFRAEGIAGTPVELLRDELPYAPGSFALILCDEVLEHFPLDPAFFVSRLIRLLRPGGQLILSTPNFATWEHRMALLRGRNPQDPMDARFVYYAHHREPVMAECEDLVRRCGGTVLERKWTDYAPPVPAARRAWDMLRYLRRMEFHRIAHAAWPSMRSYLFLRVGRGEEVTDPLPPPPLAASGEFLAPGAGRRRPLSP